MRDCEGFFGIGEEIEWDSCLETSGPGAEGGLPVRVPA